MKLYRQVSTRERMPNKDGDYITSLGIVPFYEQKFNIYIFDNRIDSMWWLEEIEIDDKNYSDCEELSKEILAKVHKHTTLCVNEDEENIHQMGVYSGIQHILNKLKG